MASSALLFRLLGVDESASSTLDKVAARANATAGALGNIGKAGAKWAAIAQGAGSAYQVITTLAPATALVAPAALAGAQALGVLKLGSDQIKKSFSALTPQVNQLKAVTGAALAPGLNSLVRSLKTDMPVITQGVRATATVFGGLARQAGALFSGPLFRTDLARIMGASTTVIGNVGKAVLTLVGAFVKVAAIAAPALAQLSGKLLPLADKIAAWVDKVNRTRQLSAWINGAVAGLSQLATIVGNVLHVVVAVLGTIASSGGSALGLLVSLTGAIRQFATSAGFLGQLKALFAALHQAVGPLLPILGQLVIAVIGALLPAVARLLPYLGRAAALLGGELTRTVSALRGPLAALAPHLGQLAVAAARTVAVALPLVPLFVRLVAWIAPAVVAVAQFTAMVANCRPAVIAIASVITVLLIPGWITAGRAAISSANTQVRSWLATQRSALSSAAAQVRAIATTIAGWVRAGAAAVASAARQVWAWLAARAAAIPAMVSSVLAFGAMIGGWIATAAAAVAGAVAVAAAWLLSIWPIVLVVAAVAAAVFLIIKYWGDIVAAAEATFRFIERIFMDIVHFFERLPGQILRALGSFNMLLYGAGRDLIAGLINGIKHMAAEAVDAAKHVVSGAVDGAKHLLGIHSPSTVFFEIGTNVTRGLAGGLAAGRPTIAGAGAALAAATVPPGSAYGGGRGGGMYVHLEIHGSVTTLRGQANELAPHVALALHKIGDSNGGTIPGVTG